MCIVGVAGSVAAQDGAALLTFGVSLGADQTFREVGEDENDLTVGLSAGLSASTSRHSFSIQTGSTLQLYGDGEEGFRDPSLSVDYTRGNDDTVLGVSFNYSQRDVDGATEIEDEFGEAFLFRDEGSVETISGSVTLETGRTAPFGTESSISFTNRIFTDTVDPDFVDARTVRAQTRLRLNISPNITLSPGLELSRSREEDALNTEDIQHRWSVSGDFVIDALWSAAADVAFVDGEIEEDDGFGGRMTRDRDQVEFNMSVSRRIPTGSLQLAYSYLDSVPETRETFTFSGNTSLPRGVQLSGSVSLNFVNDNDPLPSFSLSYSRPLPTGQLGLSLTQSVGLNNDEESVLRTNITGNYDYQIDAISSLALDASLIRIEGLGAATDEASTATVGLVYRRALTEDWNLSARLQHRVSYDNGALDDRINSLSLGLDRQFSIRP